LQSQQARTLKDISLICPILLTFMLARTTPIVTVSLGPAELLGCCSAGGKHAGISNVTFVQ
jgi:hypothetical protein